MRRAALPRGIAVYTGQSLIDTTTGDYGNNIIFNGPFYSNFGLTVLDCAKVTWGARVLCGPNVQVYAATHSVELDERQAGYERAYPVEVGDDAWIGGQVVLCGPCKIGKGQSTALTDASAKKLSSYAFSSCQAALSRLTPSSEVTSPTIASLEAVLHAFSSISNRLRAALTSITTVQLE